MLDPYIDIRILRTRLVSNKNGRFCLQFFYYKYSRTRFKTRFKYGFKKNKYLGMVPNMCKIPVRKKQQRGSCSRMLLGEERIQRKKKTMATVVDTRGRMASKKLRFFPVP